MSNAKYQEENRRFKKEQAKNLNAPMTTCERCKQFKYARYYEPTKGWVCFDCALELDAQREENYNPSARY